ncbi:LOW QUALITY PROTEIN: reverse transcriptase [Phytophthora megakarya]|uniref:Reverse transcriptase n=1 Tax=Phytophthora megakarya TaxID=4795 RepID=A0A225VH94_9STRA|nr:LOW QUALITY PROTEIN: reverse transcriptase [Phytophthora megakarya]
MKYLVGEIRDLTQEDAKLFGSIAMNYEVDQLDLLFYCPTTKEAAADRDKLMRLVMPETLQQDILHHYHTSLVAIKELAGPMIGSAVTFTREGCKKAYSDIWENVLIVKQAKDDLGSRSFNGNTELLIFLDLFSGYVIAKASASRSAQTIAETYEECVFRTFGANEVIRHDRETCFMSDFFKSFNKILDQHQRVTMAYRPQDNGSAERMVQTATRALKMYVQDLDQRDWDEYAERLIFAINTTRDRIQGETPFYMIHGWDPRSTLEAVIPVGSTRKHDRDPKRGDIGCKSITNRLENQLINVYAEAIADRADTHNDLVRPHPVEAGSRVWLYLDRVRERYAKNLAHLWHGPFRVAEKIGGYAVRLAIAGSTYSIFPVSHVSKIKLVKIFPVRPVARLEELDGDRVDFDEALLPEDS